MDPQRTPQDLFSRDIERDLASRPDLSGPESRYLNQTPENHTESGQKWRGNPKSFSTDDIVRKRERPILSRRASCPSALPTPHEADTGGNLCYLAAISRLYDALPHLKEFENIFSRSCPLSHDVFRLRARSLDQSFSSSDYSSHAGSANGSLRDIEEIRLPRPLNHPTSQSPGSAEKIHLPREAVRIGVVDLFKKPLPPRFMQFNVGKPVSESMKVNSIPYDPDTTPIFDTTGSRFAAFLSASTNTALRVLIVEDLSPEIIDALGTHFKLDPEFFAEHLSRKWNARSSWNTSGFQKPYFTARWCRPVQLHKSAIRRFWSAFDPDPNSPEWDPLLSLIDQHHHLRQIYRLAGGSRNEFCNIYRPFHLNAVTLVRAGEVGIEDSARAGWEEQLSAYFFLQNGTGPNVALLLTDPVPTISHSYPLETEVIEAASSLRRRAALDTKSHLTLNPYMSGRGVTKLRNNLRDDASATTGDILWRWLRIKAKSPKLLNDPINTILNAVSSIIDQDCENGTADIIHATDRIRRKLQGRENALLELKTCQFLLGQCLEQIEIDISGVESCAAALETLRSGDLPSGFPRTINEPQQMASNVSTGKQVFSAIQRAKERIIETFRLIEFSISVIESERAIDEAEAVTRLTELAFFFIPLGFSATIYAMQVKEFENKIGIRTWIYTAVGLLAGAYLLRLLIRSRARRVISIAYQSFVRSEAQLGPDTTIPNTAYVSWLWTNGVIQGLLHWIGRYWPAFTLLVLIVPTVTIPLIWKISKIPKDAKLGWTIFVITPAVLFIFLRSAEVLPGQLHKLGRKSHTMTFLAMFTVTVAYPALVAIIWTLGKLTVDGKIAWMAVLTVFPLVLVISLLMPIYRWFRREYPFVSSIFVVLNITTTFIRRGRSIMTDALKEMEREGYKSSRGKSDYWTLKILSFIFGVAGPKRDATETRTEGQQ